jgi:hypothetical protein
MPFDLGCNRECESLLGRGILNASLKGRSTDSWAVVITGAPAGAKQKEIASIFRPFRALIHRFSNLRAAPGAIFLSAFQAGLIHFAPAGMYRKNSHRLALSITPFDLNTSCSLKICVIA